jgi:hypothetical protein
MKPILVLVAATMLTVSCQKKTADQTATTTDSAKTVVAETIASDTTTTQKTLDIATVNADDFLIIPGQKVGKINTDSDEKSLIDAYGPANVTPHDTIYTVEGQYEIGTTLFKNTPDEAAILWKDNVKQARPDAVKMNLNLDQPNRKSRWVTDTGVRLGLTIKEIQKINGKPFKLYGFSWDYGGAVTDWQKGKLQPNGPQTFITMTFGYGELSPSLETVAGTVSGEGEFLSSNPAMQQLNPVVQQVFVRF